MMQKRTLYLSLLLVSCLLLFGFSYASAQTVTFQGKTVQRCTDVTLNITVTSPDELSAIELVFEITGDYSSPVVDFASGFTGLNRRIGPIIDGNVYRMLAFKADAADACVDASAGLVVGEITLHSADVCDGTIEILGATVVGATATASTGLVGCVPVEALPTTVVPGTVTIIDQPPTITCPAEDTVYFHWSETVTFTVDFDDPDLPNGCETLTLDVIDGPGDVDNDGNYSWAPGGSNVGVHTATIEVRDDCDSTDECSQIICVYNYPPEITFDPADTIFAVWCITLTGQVDADDPDGGPNSLLYEVIQSETTLPTWHGNGLQLNSGTGAWSWDIADDEEYLGDFVLCIKVSDGANIDPACSPENADTAWYNIHVVGFAISIEKVHQVYQGHDTTVSIFLDSTFISEQFCCDPIGGFDFLVAYDASALTPTGLVAEPGDLIGPIGDKFEYFTYRMGAYGNCDGGCPSGLLRIVAMREYNDGVFNDYHIPGPGELVKLHFYVSNDRTLEGQFIPIRFFWFDCGDNTLSDESGNWLYLGLKVYDFLWNEITDPVAYGYSGPAADCFDTVFIPGTQIPKNYPLGAIIYRNGGIDIIPAEEIDYRGDINLNGIENEIADAVMFTNYFIKGLDAFGDHIEGSIAASEVNGDGFTLTVADLVYLIRIVVGDAMPLPPKYNPNAFAAFTAQGKFVRVESNVDIGAALLVFDGHVIPSLAAEASHLAIAYGYEENTTRVLVYGSWENPSAITSGNLLEVEGNGVLSSVDAAEYGGTTMKTTTELLPTEFVLRQNYPNPFNALTTIKMELPSATGYKLSIFDINGRTVAEYSGFSEPGILTVNWDANGVASGLYFYKFEAGAFSAVKKMVLLK
jgi:hypothetical protein